MTEVDWEKLEALDEQWSDVLAARRAFCGAEDGSHFVAGFKLSTFLDTPEGEVFVTVREEFGQALRLAFPAIKAERDAKAATIRALQEALQPMADAWHKLQTDGAQHLNNDPERPSHGMGTIKQKHTKRAAELLGTLKDAPNAEG
jgi:hypothetical protein